MLKYNINKFSTIANVNNLHCNKQHLFFSTSVSQVYVIETYLHSHIEMCHVPVQGDHNLLVSKNSWTWWLQMFSSQPYFCFVLLSGVFYLLQQEYMIRY